MWYNAFEGKSKRNEFESSEIKGKEAGGVAEKVRGVIAGKIKDFDAVELQRRHWNRVLRMERRSNLSFIV